MSNDLNLILQDKNINCINDYDAINTFIAKLGLSITVFKKKNVASFPKQDITPKKKQIEFYGKLKV